MFAVLAGACAFVGLRYSNTGHRPPEHFTKGSPQLVPPAPRAARLSDEDSSAARVIAARFIDTAVLRQRIDDSWEITAPSLRQGMTRAEWDTGNIPVTPFPAEAVLGIKYRVDWSGTERIYLKIAIIPKRSAKMSGGAFDMGLERSGATDGHRWLVDYWVPSSASSANPGKRSVLDGPALPPTLKSRVSAAWILAPVGGILLVLLSLPIWLGGRGWLRNRRANRLYRESA
jgi:hypothetical protein